MKMKRIISLVCILTMLLAVLPVLNASAARKTNVWAGWSLSGDAVVENGILKLGSKSGGSSTAIRPYDMTDSFTVKFTARIVKDATNYGLMVLTGAYRGGMYMYPAKFNPFSPTGAGVGYNIGYDWHDYRIEVDKAAGKAKYFIDGKAAASMDMGLYSSAAQMKFWTSGSGAHLEVEDFQYWNHDGRNPVAQAGHVTPAEYTEAFVTDWKESTDGWDLYEGPEVVWNKEEGRVDVDVLGGSSQTIYGISKDVKTPRNYDWEWDMNVRENVGNLVQFAAKGGGHTNYMHFRLHSVTTNPEDQKGWQFGIMVPVYENEWHHYKIQKRGDFMTLLLDNGECHTLEVTKSSEPTYFRIMATGAASAICRFSIGEIKYTPYFTEVEMEKPFHRSEYKAGTDVTLKAKPEADVDYLDYFVNGVCVGKGARENNYEYVLKNVKVGAYTVSAGVGEVQSVATEFFVRAPYDADIELSAKEINLGESVNVNVCEEDIIADYPIGRVEYFVNNVKVGESQTAPYHFTVSGLNVGTHSIHAKIHNKDGYYFVTEARPVAVKASNANDAAITREYELDYDVASAGSVNINDGYFKLSMNHSESGVTYETDEGSATMNVGKGTYKVVVTSGIADVYYNGQFSFSFRMPQETAAQKVDYSGVSNFVIGGTGVKATYISEKFSGNGNIDKSFLDFGTRHAISFSPLETRTEMSQRDNLVNYSLEFDKTDASDEKLEYWDGEHYMLLNFKDGKIYTRTQEKMINQTEVIDYQLEGAVQPGYYRLTVARGMAQLFCNNRWMGSFAAPIEASRVHLKREMTNPSATTIVEVKGTNDRYYHIEDFEGNTEFAPGEHWVEEASTKAEIVTENGNSYAKLTGKGKYYLNAYTQNSHLKFRANIAKGTDFNFITKYNTIYYINRLGYDSENECWYSQQYKLERDPGTDMGWSQNRYTTPGTFEYGKWHDFEIITDEFTVEIKCDGVTVFKHDNIYSVSRGNVGFELNSGTILFDDFSYVGEGKATAGLISAVGNTGANYNDFIMYGENDLSVSGNRGTRTSTDGGKTWGAIGAANNYDNIVKLQSGKIVRANFSNLRYTASVSEDNGKTWRTAGVITERIPGYRVALNGCIFQAKNGRLWFTTDEAGSEDFGINGVFYSDDEGETWTESQTLMDTRNHGVNIQEIRIVDMPEENRVRMYGRSWRGFIQYVESTDGGVTFDQNWHHSEFLAAMCTFCVMRDNSEEQTYYALFNYDGENAWSGRYSNPRNRLVLAVSYDGCKTWEFAMDVINFGDFPQGVHRNHSMDIFGDKIYIGYTGEGNEGVIYTIDKTKLRTSKRMQECLERIFVGVRTDEFVENYTVISKTSGKAKIYDSVYDVTVADGRMDAVSMARAMGADMVQSGSEITFTIGEGKVVFTEGSTSCNINGETKDMGKVIMQGGLLDIKAVAEIYNRPVYEDDNSWTLYYNNIFNKWYAEEIANLV